MDSKDPRASSTIYEEIQDLQRLLDGIPEGLLQSAFQSYRNRMRCLKEELRRAKSKEWKMEERKAQEQRWPIKWVYASKLPVCTSSLRITHDRIEKIAKDTGGCLVLHAGHSTIQANAIAQDLHLEVLWDNPYRMADVFLLARDAQHTVTLTVRDLHANHKADSHDGVVAAFRAYSNPRRVERIAAKISRIITAAVGTPAQDEDGGGA